MARRAGRATNGPDGGLDDMLTRRFRAALRRERYRGSRGPPLRREDVALAWARSRGRCAHCGVLLTWDYDPRRPALEIATLDRVDATRNLTYGRSLRRRRGGPPDINCRFLCRGCNHEKGIFEYARALRALLLECRGERR